MIVDDEIAAKFRSAAELFGGNRLDEARTLFLEIIQRVPEHLSALNGLGIIALKSGRLQEAQHYIQKALSADPCFEKGYNTLGQIMQSQGDLSKAEELFRKALTLKPDFPEALANLGEVLMSKGNTSEAVLAFRQASALRPDRLDFLHILAVTLDKADRYEEAEPILRRIVVGNPSSASACNELGKCLAGMNRFNEAMEWYRKALELTPDYPFALNGLGTAYQATGNLARAEDMYRQAVAADPEFYVGWENLGLVLAKLRRPCEGLAALDKVFQEGKATGATYAQLGYIQGRLGRADQAVISFSKAVELDPSAEIPQSSLLMTMQYCPDISAREIFEKSVKWGQTFAPSRSPEPFFAGRGDNNRIHIGYLSPDLCNHVVSLFIEPVLRNHDHSRFEIFGYADIDKPDEVTRRLSSYCDHWYIVKNLSDAALVELITADNIDILVDLAGHTFGNRLRIFGKRPAPVQVTWLGYPGTTGVQAINYRLTDDIADPEGEADLVHSEKLIRLPDGFLCYAPPDCAPAVTPLPCDKLEQVTFGAFNKPGKISSATISLWKQILDRLPLARLALKNMSFAEREAGDAFLELLVSSGLDKSRIILLPTAPTLEAHLDCYRLVDISLDTFPYTGTTNTCESLWMGVPVLTLKGDRHAARVSASILHRVGLDDWIAESADEYVKKAVEFSGDLKKLREIRAGLRNRMRLSPLCNGASFTKNLEETYLQIKPTHPA